MSVPLRLLPALAALGMLVTVYAGEEENHPVVRQAQANGVVNSASPGRINLTHEAIPILGWPPMQMDFDLDTKVDSTTLRPGLKVRFTVREVGPTQYRVITVTPLDK